MARKPLAPPKKLPETFALAEELLAGVDTPDINSKLTELKNQTPKEYWPEFKYFFDAAMAIMPPNLAEEGELK